MNPKNMIGAAEIAGRLAAGGFLDWPENGKVDTAEIDEAFVRWQGASGLHPDGVLGPISARHLMHPYAICGCHVAALEARAGLVKWDKTHLTYAFAKYLPRLDPELQNQSMAESWSRWSAVCGITHERIDDARRADVVIDTIRQRPGGTLAQAELPLDGGGPLRLWRDERELWSLFQSLRGRINLTLVDMHELGHILGIGHLDGEPGSNVMDSIYNPAVDTLRGGDIAAAVARYPVADNPPPPPPPADRARVNLLVEFNPTTGEIAGGKITAATGGIVRHA